MELSFLKALINSISQFSRLSSCSNIKLKPIQTYYQKIDEALKLLRPILDEIVDSEIASNEKLNKLFEDMDLVVTEARELMENWHQMASKVYFVLQIESLMIRIQMFGLEICGLVKSLLQSVSLASNSLCIQKFQLIESEQTSDVIKEALKDVQENTKPSSQSLVKIANALSLISNEELLLEILALENAKTKANHESDGMMDQIDHMFSLVTLMHENLTKLKQCQASNGVPIPADFCCPLSLELMADPVIMASGQTYERAFIKRWLDQGLTVCPKTHQTLSHTNLIPNYNVKALIANWCELNNIKIPDPIKSLSLSQSPVLHPHVDCTSGDSLVSPHTGNVCRISSPKSPESIKYIVDLHRIVSSNGTHINDRPSSPLHLKSYSEGGRALGTQSGLDTDIAQVSLLSLKDSELSSEDWSAGSDAALVSSSKDVSEVHRVEEQFQDHNRSNSVSSVISSTGCQQGAGDGNEASQNSGDLTHYSSDASGELTSEGSAPSAPRREPEFSSRLGSRSQSIWRRPSERFVPKIVSSPALDSRPDLSGVETQVRKLIEDLQSGSDDMKRAAASELRLLAKHNMDTRIVISNCGTISHLVPLLHSTDLKTQENAVTTLLNLSINYNNKAVIANAGAIDPLIHVLKTGNAEARENSAAALFSLSVIEENKVKIGRSGAIKPLVELLGNGTPRGKKDASTALFNLSIFHENKVRIVQAGAVKYLVELMDPAAGMVDKAVAVLANLSTIPEGQNAIGQEGGIPVLVEVVELGSSRGKENAAAALLQLCTNNNKFCSMILQEGAVPPLVALSQSGTPRAKEKAKALLSCFRNHRHGNAGRS